MRTDVARAADALNAKWVFTEKEMRYINNRKHEQSPAVLWGIECQEVHAGKDSREGVEVRCQTGWELAPGGEKQHDRALCAVSIQKVHQILRENEEQGSIDQGKSLI